MISSPAPRRAAAILLCCGLAAVGCNRSVAGTATAENVSAGINGSLVPVPVPLHDLLLDPSDFPSEYQAVVLAPEAAEDALRGLEGVPSGATVTPPDCTPIQPAETAAASGTTPQGALTVVLARVNTTLAARREQLARCPTFTVQTEVAASTVTATLLPPPPVADDALAIDLTQEADPPEKALTLVAQHGDVRIYASMTVVDGADPDTFSLDAVFTDAVLAVRDGARR